VARPTSHSAGEKVSIFALATLLLATIVGSAFAVGFLVGRIWL
jgi:hypothetical protein